MADTSSPSSRFLRARTRNACSRKTSARHASGWRGRAPGACKSTGGRTADSIGRGRHRLASSYIPVSCKRWHRSHICTTCTDRLLDAPLAPAGLPFRRTCSSSDSLFVSPSRHTGNLHWCSRTSLKGGTCASLSRIRWCLKHQAWIPNRTKEGPVSTSAKCPQDVILHGTWVSGLAFAVVPTYHVDTFRGFGASVPVDGALVQISFTALSYEARSASALLGHDASATV